MTTQLAGCVLLDEERRILLLHRNKKGIVQWELPGGKIETGETPAQAARRELKEELGVTVSTVKQLGQAQFSDHQNRQYHYTWFLALSVRGFLSIREPNTFDDFRYFKVTELEALDLSANMKAFLSQLKNRELFS